MRDQPAARATLPGLPPAEVESERVEPLWMLALFALALAVRLPGSGGDFWIDEIATVLTYLRRPLAEIASSYVTANQHFFYSILARISISAFGENPFAVRLPAILFGAAGVPALYFLARSMASRREALAASLLLLVSYHHAYFSQNARGYTMYLFFCLLSTGFLFRALAHDRRGAWIAFVLCSVGNIYVHLNGVFFIVGQVASALLLYWLPARGSDAGRARIRHLLIAFVASGVLSLALYAPILKQMMTFFATETRDVGWLPSLQLIKVILRDAAPGVAGLAALAAALLVGFGGLASLARSAPLFVLVMFLPLLAGLAVIMAMGVGTYPRFFVILLPFGMVVVARGIRVITDAIGGAVGAMGRAGARRAFVLLVVIVGLAAGVGLPRLYTLPKQNYTGALALVERQRGEGDLVAGAYSCDIGCQYYDPTVLSARSADDLAEILRRGRPVWLLGTLVNDMRDRDPELSALIDARFREVARFRGLVGDGDIVVWRSAD